MRWGVAHDADVAIQQLNLETLGLLVKKAEAAAARHPAAAVATASPSPAAKSQDQAGNRSSSPAGLSANSHIDPVKQNRQQLMMQDDLSRHEGVMGMTVCVMHRHGMDAVVQRFGCALLLSLLTQNKKQKQKDGRKSRLRNAGAREVASAAMESHPRDKEVQVSLRSNSGTN